MREHEAWILLIRKILKKFELKTTRKLKEAYAYHFKNLNTMHRINHFISDLKLIHFDDANLIEIQVAFARKLVLFDNYLP